MPIVFDVETKHTFREVDDPKKLGITVLALYDYVSEKGMVFTEKELAQSFPYFEKASCVVGYNSNGFDLPVLQPYYPGNIKTFPSFDLLEDIRSKIGRRIGLNDVAFATLGKKKSGHGLQAIEHYKQGRWEELKRYCLDDVMITKELFDYGAKYGEVSYLNERGKVPIKVDWAKQMNKTAQDQSHMTLPF